ncbi:LamG domain-containing protein, partial [Singulisphaera rosea]
DRPMREIRSELAKGRPVTLVGKTGGPRWSRMITAKTTSQIHSDRAGTFKLSAFTDICLLELVPDPQWQSYRFSAQVRHDNGDPHSEVGLYVGRRMYPYDGKDVHFFVRMDFNVVGSRAEYLGLIPGHRPRIPPPRTNTVRFHPHLYSDETVMPNIAARFPGAREWIRYEPLGLNNGRWHDLEVVVTPTTLTATWNGQKCPLPVADIERDIIDDSAKGPELSPMLIPKGLRPSFDARGGLGLYMKSASAAFRSISLTPL